MEYKNFYFLHKLFLLLSFVSCAHTVQRESTQLLINYFDKLVIDNTLTIEHVRNLAYHDTLQNPILELEAHADSKLLSAYKSINTILAAAAKSAASGKNVLDHAAIKTWAVNKVAELEGTAHTKEEVHETTREVQRPMRFVPIVPGKYNSAIDGREFTIYDCTQMQETEVTQYHWSQIMGYNPSANIEGVGSEEISINGNKIKMLPDHPVENVSFNEIQDFITKLNNQDEEYRYWLPSVHAYEALLQNMLGTQWQEKIKYTKINISQQSTCASGTTEYVSYNNQRVWDVIGNVWEFTHDINDFGKGIHLVFGGGYKTNIPACHSLRDLLRPIVSRYACDGCIGFRLMRTRKTGLLNKDNHRIVWEESHVQQDAAWQWNKTGSHAWIWEKIPGFPVVNSDSLAYMINHKDSYSEQQRKTIDVLLNHYGSESDKNRIRTLLAAWYFDYDYGEIVDIRPLCVLKQLKKIYLYSEEIINISVLSELSQLQELSLSGMPIKDLSPLLTMTQLKNLGLYNNKLVDVSLLSKLNQLERLTITTNNVSDLSPLSNLKQLKELRLAECDIVDINPLSSLTQLENLDLEDNKIKDIRALSGMRQLTRLDLSNNQIDYINPLSNLMQLQYLDLANNQVNDVSPLSAVQNLQNLELANNRIKDVSPLSCLIKLNYLNLSSNNVSDVRLNGLISLETLNLKKNQVSDLNPAATLTSLTDLDLGENQIHDVSPLANMKQLKYLYLSSNKICHINPLSELTQLTYLNISLNEIHDVSPLSGLAQLSLLSLSDNKISDIKSLSSLSHLWNLNLYGNPLSDISALYSFTQLGYLDLRECPIKDKKLDVIRKNNPEIHIEI